MIYSNNSRSNRCAAAIPIIFVFLLIGVLGVSFGYLFNTKLFEVLYKMLFQAQYVGRLRRPGSLHKHCILHQLHYDLLELWYGYIYRSR